MSGTIWDFDAEVRASKSLTESILFSKGILNPQSLPLPAYLYPITFLEEMPQQAHFYSLFKWLPIFKWYKTSVFLARSDTWATWWNQRAVGSDSIARCLQHWWHRGVVAVPVSQRSAWPTSQHHISFTCGRLNLPSLIPCVISAVHEGSWVPYTSFQLHRSYTTYNERH